MVSFTARAGAWWGSLQQREKLLVAGAALLLAWSVAYFGFWQPMQERNELLSEDIRTTESLLLRLNSLAPGKSGNTKKRKGRNLSLLAVIDQTVKAAGIGDAVKRIQPDGESAARIWLEQANFEKLLRWLHRLDFEYGVKVNEATINRDETPGVVRARIGFQRS